jgi:diguanylate cyclase (GGDEF)-like protein
VLVSNCDARTLATVAEKTLAVVSREPVRLDDGTKTPATVSIGACLVGPGQTIDAINAKADAALYAAKAAGRNSIVFDEGSRQPETAKGGVT